MYRDTQHLDESLTAWDLQASAARIEKRILARQRESGHYAPKKSGELQPLTEWQRAMIATHAAGSAK